MCHVGSPGQAGLIACGVLGMLTTMQLVCFRSSLGVMHRPIARHGGMRVDVPCGGCAGLHAQHAGHIQHVLQEHPWCDVPSPSWRGEVFFSLHACTRVHAHAHACLAVVHAGQVNR